MSVGMALAWTGVPLGMYFNHMFPVVAWSPVFMFLSILLIARYDKLLAGRLPSFNSFFLCVVLFQFMMLAYGLFSENLTGQLVSFHLYIVALVLALSLNPFDTDCDSSRVIVWTFLLSAACSILGAYFLWNGRLVGELAWQLRQDDQDYALEPFTVSIGALTNFACILFMPQPKNRLFRWFVYLLAAVDCYIILFSGKRTPLLVMLAISMVYVFKSGRFRAKPSLAYSAILFLTLGCLYVGSETFSAQVDDQVKNTIYGIANIFGNTDVVDDTGSAVMRYESRAWASDYIRTSFTASDYLFGSGYMTRHLDSPLIQAYLDMGLLGFLGYLLLVIVYPARFLLRSALNSTQLLALSLCLYSMLSFFNSGTPYLWSKYIPVVMLAFFCQRQALVSSQLRMMSGPPKV